MKNDKIIKIIRVAKKYYESHMDQKIIAQEEDISVSTVSRMLKKAEEMGYIKITVEYPFQSFQMRLLQYRKMSVEQQQKIYLPI